MTVDIKKLDMRITDLDIEVNNLIALTEITELRRDYLKWYAQVQYLVNSHLPSMIKEFDSLFYGASNSDGESDTYKYFGIRSYLRTTPSWNSSESFRSRFLADIEQQRGILLAISSIIDLRLLDISALVTADMVDGELNEARLLFKQGFIRAAGAIAGVAIEAHLKLLHDQSGEIYIKKDGIVALATRLRLAKVITLGDEKKCIAISEIRNNCSHKKKQEPTKETVKEMLDDVNRFVKRVQVI